MAKPKRARAKPAPLPEIPTSLPDDLPAPSTSRNLLPRLRATSLARSAHSGSLPNSRTSSRRSSASASGLANMSSALSNSRPATPAGGGTISIESGNPPDPEHSPGPLRGGADNSQLQNSTRSATSSSAMEHRDISGGQSPYKLWSRMPRHKTPSDREIKQAWDHDLQVELSNWHQGNHQNQSAASNSSSMGMPMAASSSSSLHYPSGSGQLAGPGMEGIYIDGGQAGFHSEQPLHYGAHNRQHIPTSSNSNWPMEFTQYGISEMPDSEPPPDMPYSQYDMLLGPRDRKRKRSTSPERGGTTTTVPHTSGQEGWRAFESDDTEVARELMYSVAPDSLQSGHLIPTPTKIAKVDRKGKGKARAEEPLESVSARIPDTNDEKTPVQAKSANTMKPKLLGDPLSTYSCPICFSPPINATITPCGHICCGECLFAAVKATSHQIGPRGPTIEARCPVCRSIIPGWDGRGGGVIGLKVRATFSL